MGGQGKSETVRCQICGEVKVPEEVLPGELVRAAVVEVIRREHPDWSSGGYICLSDLNRYRAKHVQELLEEDKGELSDLEDKVLQSLQAEELLSKNVNTEFESRLTFGQRMADKIAEFGGSWRFIGIFALVLVVWIFINVSVLLFRHPFDPYPFILLNLILSCLAAIQAPVIMMSQNRQESRDRLRAEHDYQVNLKAELEIRALNEKVDQLRRQQWQRLLEIQQVQMDLIEELVRKDEGVETGTRGVAAVERG